jgi:VWFA-related protein
MRANDLALALLLAAPMMMAQSNASVVPGQNSDESMVTLRQEVRNVVIDVVVTDKHGQPVKSLQKSHFQVTENGVAQQILFFEEHGPAEEAAKPAPRSDLPSDVHTNVTTAPANSPMMVLLLDAVNTRPDQQSYVHAQINEYLKNLPQGTRMAIFTLGDRLQLLQGFTGDPAILRAALSNTSYPMTTTLSPGGLTSFNSQVSSVRASLQRFGNGPTSVGQDLRIRYTLDALNAVAAYLADLPGRKSLLWFAGSVPWTINPDFSLVTDSTGRVDYSDQLKQLADVMTVGRIAIYPIDAHGLSTPPGYSPDNVPTAGGGSSGGGDPSASGGSFHVGGGGATFDNRVSSGSAFGAREMASQMNIAGNHMSMSNLAVATGGHALYNTNGIAGAVSKVQAIGDFYYTLAYAPSARKYDGALRHIDVKVSQPAVKLEYRRGYYADDPAKTASKMQIAYYSNPLRAAMKRGAPDSTEIPFKVQVKEARQQPDPAKPSDRLGNDASSLKGPLVRFDFHWNVDPSGIQFTSTSNGMHRAEVDAVLDAYDADGKVLNNTYATLPLNFTDAQFDEVLKSGLRMKQSLDVPSGIVYLRAGVVDPKTGRTGSTEFPLNAKPE